MRRNDLPYRAAFRRAWMATASALAFSAACAAGGAVGPDPFAGEDEYLLAQTARFTPAQDSVCLKYRVVYRLLGLNIKRMGTATVRTTGGRWDSCGSQPGKEVSLVEFSMDSNDHPAADGRGGMVSFHNRVVCVLTASDLDAFLFAKRTRQRFALPWRRIEANHTEIYDLESGSLNYWRHDYSSGQETTNMVGRQELARQGREVCKLIRLAADAHRSVTTNTVLNAGNPFCLYISGELVPYTAEIRGRNVPVKAVGTSFPCLSVWAYPSKDVRGRRHETFIWAASFEDFCGALDAPGMASLANGKEKLLMVPLLVDFDLAVGSVRSMLVDAGVGRR